MKYAFIEYEREKKSRMSEWAVSFMKPFTAENIMFLAVKECA